MGSLLLLVVHEVELLKRIRSINLAMVSLDTSHLSLLVFPPNASYSHTPFAWHSLTWSPFLLLALTTLYAAWRMRASPIHIWWIVINLRAVLMVYL